MYRFRSGAAKGAMRCYIRIRAFLLRLRVDHSGLCHHSKEQRETFGSRIAHCSNLGKRFFVEFGAPRWNN